MSGFYRKCLALGVILFGVVLTGYPWLSNYLYEQHVDTEAGAYQAEVEKVDSSEQEAMWREAQDYNERLAAGWIQPPGSSTGRRNQERMEYESLLAVDDLGTMGFLEIPKISVCLPIFHGTSDEVLQRGIGHIQGTALPVGGAGMRPILSGHTGINTSRMLTDLIDMEEGDIFLLHILDDTLTYRVCDIQVIEPDDVEALTAKKGEDLVSLLTCTPYGVNSHRLVVTGERTELNEEDQTLLLERDSAVQTAQWSRAYRRAVLCGLGSGLLLYLIGSMFLRIQRKRKREQAEEE